MNLVPGDRPQDPYAGVAAMVQTQPPLHPLCYFVEQISNCNDCLCVRWRSKEPEMQQRDMKLPSNWRGRLVERWVVSVCRKSRTLQTGVSIFLYILKVVKQTVMTVVYGVTWVGGRLQIAVSYI